MLLVLPGLRLPGNEGVEKKTETTIMGYIIRIPITSFLANQRPVTGSGAAAQGGR